METVREALLASALFGSLPASELDTLEGAGTRVEFRAGDVIWEAGDRAPEFAVVVRGALKLTHPLASGRAALLSVFGAGETIGDVAAINDMPYPACCMAISDGVLFRIPRVVVRAIADRDPDLQRRFALAPLAHMQRLQGKVATLHAGEIDARLAHALLDLATRLGRKRDDGAWIVPTPLSRQELADLISARIESVIRAMSRWSKEGIVETRVTGFLILKREVLADLARDATPKSG